MMQLRIVAEEKVASKTLNHANHQMVNQISRFATGILFASNWVLEANVAIAKDSIALIKGT